MNINDPDIMLPYLLQKGYIEPDASITVRELPGGVSCLTVLVRRDSGPDFVIKQARPKLKVAEEWYSDPERIHIEGAAMRVLQELTPAGSVPKLLFEDKEHHLIGMEAIPRPHDNWKTLLLHGRINMDYVAQFAQILAGIHRLSYQKEAYREAFGNRHFFKTLRIEPYYTFTAKQTPGAASFLQRLTEDTLAVQLSLVHGDYSPKNVIVYRDRLILLDHEVMHFGDGAFDVGFSMTHLISKGRYVPGRQEAFKAAALHYWQTYQKDFPPPEGWEERSVRHTIACMLARVRGKSLLEYLGAEEQLHQERRCLELIGDTPSSMEQLIEKAIER